uniref:Secreted protein n=1 Tax=Anopheles coluzzii TaxID=1518534 RepID=A0A8W7PHT4_ANOCL
MSDATLKLSSILMLITPLMTLSTNDGSDASVTPSAVATVLSTRRISTTCVCGGAVRLCFGSSLARPGPSWSGPIAEGGRVIPGPAATIPYARYFVVALGLLHAIAVLAGTVPRIPVSLVVLLLLLLLLLLGLLRIARLWIVRIFIITRWQNAERRLPTVRRTSRIVVRGASSQNEPRNSRHRLQVQSSVQIIARAGRYCVRASRNLFRYEVCSALSNAASISKRVDRPLVRKRARARSKGPYTQAAGLQLDRSGMIALHFAA